MQHTSAPRRGTTLLLKRKMILCKRGSIVVGHAHKDDTAWSACVPLYSVRCVSDRGARDYRPSQASNGGAKANQRIWLLPSHEARTRRTGKPTFVSLKNLKLSSNSASNVQTPGPVLTSPMTEAAKRQRSPNRASSAFGWENQGLHSYLLSREKQRAAIERVALSSPRHQPIRAGFACDSFSRVTTSCMEQLAARLHT